MQADQGESFNLPETREILEKFETFFNKLLGFPRSSWAIERNWRELLPHGRSKENANHFSLFAQTIVDEDIQFTGTVTWQARPKMLIRASGDHKL
jgi:hypothetical protein